MLQTLDTKSKEHSALSKNISRSLASFSTAQESLFRFFGMNRRFFLLQSIWDLFNGYRGLFPQFRTAGAYNLPPSRSNPWLRFLGIGKVKCTLVQALRLCRGPTTHRGSRGITLLFLGHGTRRGWGVCVTPRPLFTPWKDAVPIVQEAGWASRPVCKGAENLAPTEIRFPDRQARSHSLHLLSYPGPLRCLGIMPYVAICHNRIRTNINVRSLYCYN